MELQDQLAHALKESVQVSAVKYHKKTAFEVYIDNVLIFSKLEQKMFPDFEEIIRVANDVSSGSEPR